MDSRETTRGRIKRMEYEKPLPTELNGKLKHYEEVFINPGGEEEHEEAELHLKKIQQQHPESQILFLHLYMALHHSAMNINLF